MFSFNRIAFGRSGACRALRIILLNFLVVCCLVSIMAPAAARMKMTPGGPEPCSVDGCGGGPSGSSPSGGSSKGDIFDCFEALAPLDKAAQAAEASGIASACMSEASGDPIMAMTIAALTTAAVGGAFSTIEQCNQLIDSIIGQVIAAALLEVPMIKNNSEAASQLEQFAQGTSPAGTSFKDIIESIPALRALPVWTWIQCGCNVAGLPGEFERLAYEYGQSVQGCANFVGDAIDAMLGGFMESAFAGHGLVGGIQQQVDASCPFYQMPPNTWTADNLFLFRERQCHTYICAEGLVIVEKTGASGQKLSMCSGSCPEVTTVVEGGRCWSQDVFDDRCQFRGQNSTCCLDGQKVVQWGFCGPACEPGTQYWDTQKGLCRNCPTGWGAVYPSSMSSVGFCIECPFDQIYDASTKTCEPLFCPPPYIFTNPKYPHRCLRCPAGQLFSASTGTCGSTSSSIATPPVLTCPRGQHLVGGACVPVRQPPAQSSSPRCPPGHVFSANTGACAPPVAAAPSAVTCPPGRQLVAGSCLPVRQDRTQLSRPGLQCQPGSVLNSNGTACIRVSGASAQPVTPLTTVRPPARPSVVKPVPPPSCPPGTRLVNGHCAR